jgi:stage III sporulation protein AD
MQIIWVAISAIVAVFASLFVKSVKPEFAVYISLAMCLLIMLVALDKVGDIIDQFLAIGDAVGISADYLKVMLKITGITYITGFAADLCKDAGHQAIANQVTIFGRLAVIATSMPVLTAVLDTVMGLFT